MANQHVLIPWSCNCSEKERKDGGHKVGAKQYWFTLQQGLPQSCTHILMLSISVAGLSIMKDLILHLHTGLYLKAESAMPTFSPVIPVPACPCALMCINTGGTTFNCELFWHNQIPINSFHIMPMYNGREGGANKAKCGPCHQTNLKMLLWWQ